MLNTTQDDLTDEQYEIADRISLYLEARDGQDFTASQLARAAGCSTQEAHTVLAWMVRTHTVGLAGRGGAWRRYRAHRHGELNEL